MSSILDALQGTVYDYESIHNQIKYASFKKSEIILQGHETSDFVHIITRGLVKAYTIANSGEESISVIYGNQDLFPLSWIIKATKVSVYYQAITDCEIVLVPKKILLEQMKKSAEVSFAMNERILKQHEIYAYSINNLEYKYGRERLAYRLLMLSSRFGEKKDGTIILPRINQYNLAAMINMSRESLSREMSRFERHDVLKYMNSCIVILKESILLAEIGEDEPILFANSEN